MTKNIIIIILSFISSYSFSQSDTTKKSNFNLDFGADLMSRYVWRGTQYGGNSPSIQPSLTLSYKNFEIGAWGAYSTGGVNSSQEMDLFLTYSFLHNMFTFITTDYFFPSNSSPYNYYNYGNQTGHVLETGLTFNGNTKIPITFSAYVNVLGADAPTIGDNPADTSTFNKKTGIQHSNYFELGYSNTIRNTSVNLFVGFTLSTPKKADNTIGYIGETGWYGNKSGIVNVGISASKSQKVTKDYSIPISVSLITNPQSEKVFLVFGISF